MKYLETSFKNLYKSELKADSQKISLLLTSLTLPTLSKEQHELLDVLITIEELEETIKNLWSRCTPGFIVKFYKIYSDEVFLLLSMYENSIKKGTIPATEVLISLILKKKVLWLTYFSFWPKDHLKNLGYLT